METVVHLIGLGHQRGLISGLLRVLENLESPGILLWHFPGLESSGNLLNSSKNMKFMAGRKEN